jgi:hypothetical protein
MQRAVLILGGYGNFGKRIASALVKTGVSVIVAGRDRRKAEALVRSLPGNLALAACFDARRDLDTQLKTLKPAVVVNTCGPFQNSDYGIAESCIRCGIHYIDLADGRDFVAGITTLDRSAKEAGVAVVAGASTVPGLSSAVIEYFKSEFSEISSLKYGVSPGQKAERGLATTQGILSYVGRPLRPFVGQVAPTYGWQDIYRQTYPEIGKRWMANCDVPDLDLLPPRYGIKSIRFSAGLELGFMHLGLWALSWLVRLGFPIDLPRHAKLLLKISDAFDAVGSAAGGMHMILRGKSPQGKNYERRWLIIARNGQGPHIPTIPAIVLAEKLARGELDVRGALPCVGLVLLEEYLGRMREYNVVTHSEVSGWGN